MRHVIREIKFEAVENDPKGLLGFTSFILDGIQFTGLAVFARSEGGIRISWPERNRGIKRIKSAQPVDVASFQFVEDKVSEAIYKEEKQ